MDNMQIDGLFISKNDIVVGDNIRSEARKHGCNIMYAMSGAELLNHVMLCKYGVIFLGEDYLKYYDLFYDFVATSYFSKYCIVFIDESIESIDYSASNRNIYKISSKHISIAMHDIISRTMMLYQTITSSFNTCKMDRYLTNYLIDLGFSQKYVGFQYIKESVITAVERNKYITSYSSEIYPNVALKNNTQISNIEKSIRTSIKTAYKDHKQLFIDNNFVDNNYISNKVFLSHLIDKIKYEISVNEELK